MNAQIEATNSDAVLGVRRFELGELWAEVRLNYAFSVNPRNYTVIASHGIPASMRERLFRNGAHQTGQGEVYNLDKPTAVALAQSIVRERAKDFGIRAY